MWNWPPKNWFRWQKKSGSSYFWGRGVRSLSIGLKIQFPALGNYEATYIGVFGEHRYLSHTFEDFVARKIYNKDHQKFPKPISKIYQFSFPYIYNLLAKNKGS